MGTKVEVYGDIVEIKVDMNLKIKAYNDGEFVWEGTVSEFLEVNEYDGATVAHINELAFKDSHEEDFMHSGVWVIEKA